MQSNKGRFKCPHEVQAVWNYVLTTFSPDESRLFTEGDFGIERLVSSIAENLHKARLIHGTIYDEYGRIEDKDVAHEICLSYEEHFWWIYNLDGHIIDIVRTGKIRGTIFY